MSRKKTSYGFTWNNYPENWDSVMSDLFATGRFRYIVGGEEIGEETQTPHIQGHIDLKNGTTMSGAQKFLQKHGIKCSLIQFQSKQHCKNNRKYCEKDGKFQTWGEKPQQGKRTDLERYMEDIKENPSKRRRVLMEEHSSVMARYPKFADEYKSLVQKIETLDWKDGDPPNYWIYGKSGSGKSFIARQLCAFEDLYDKTLDTWWQNYDDQSHVLIDDFSPDYRQLATPLKRWSDRYPFPADIKCGGRVIRPKHVIVTSQYHPRQCFTSTDSEAIFRRFRVLDIMDIRSDLSILKSLLGQTLFGQKKLEEYVSENKCDSD